MARKGFLETVLDALLGPPQRINSAVVPYRRITRGGHHARCNGHHCSNPWGTHRRPFCLTRKSFAWVGGPRLCKRCFQHSIR